MSRFDAIDLSELASPDVVQAPDYAALVATRKADIVARVRLLDPALADTLAATLAIEGELITKLVEAGAYREVLHYARVNDAARAVMLAYATGDDLGHLGALYGVARQTGETDARLRGRIQLAPEAFSTAGPTGAYAFHALRADPAIVDVTVISEQPGRVDVLPLVASGAPSAALIARVQAALDADGVRPLTDQVVVRAPVVVPYTIAALLQIGRGPDPGVVKTAAQAAVTAVATNRRRVGARVTRSSLIAALHVPGVQGVVMSAPTADIAPGVDRVAVLTAMTLTTEVVDV